MVLRSLDSHKSNPLLFFKKKVPSLRDVVPTLVEIQFVIRKKDILNVVIRQGMNSNLNFEFPSSKDALCDII